MGKVTRWGHALSLSAVIVGAGWVSYADAQRAGAFTACCPRLDATHDRLFETDDTLPIAYDTLRDNRDGKAYKTVAIGKQVWMAENLNYRPQTGNSWCYNNDNYYCDKYGRLYDWKTAKAACPSGWHLPSYREWEDLGIAVGGVKERSKVGYDWHCLGRLGAKSGWENHEGESIGGGTDDYGFSALPGGSRSSGHWWTATESYSGSAYGWEIIFGVLMRFGDNRTMVGQSVRCVRDAAAGVYSGNLGPLTCAVPRVYFPGLIEGASGTIGGGRSRSNVIGEIMRNSPSLRYAYNKRWRERPGLAGKLSVKFAVNEYGKVLSAQVAESTLADSSLEAAVVTNVKRWEFGRIDAFDDVTEVTCPIVFSP